MYISPSVGAVYAQAAREMGVDVEEEQMETVLYETWLDLAPTNDVRERNLISSDSRDRDLWRHFLRIVYENVEDLQELDFTNWFEHLYHRFGRAETFSLFQETRDVLETVRKRYPVVGVVSNWDSRLLHICHELEIETHFDFILPSAVAGYRKPSPRIFSEALDRAGFQPHQTVHVGDSMNDDVRGARESGLHGILLERNSDGKEHNVPVLNDLSELPAYLSSLSRDSENKRNAQQYN